MKKDNFYLCLTILNILLCLCILGMFLVFFITCYFTSNAITPNCVILLCILAKIFLLYILFSTFEKFYPHSTLSKVAEELKTNSSSRKSALLLSFGYDTVIMLCCLLFSLLKGYRFEWISIPAYEIITLGGVCMFYVTLFVIWKIQNQLKKR